MALKPCQVFVPLILFLLALQVFDIVQSRRFKTSPKFSDYFHEMVGVQKGHSVSSLRYLKNYLNTFGYYNPNWDISLHNDKFDDHLESALEEYQKFYNLKVTGTLDSDTIKQMMIPRCGVADILHGKENSTDIHDHDHSPWFVSKFSYLGKWSLSETNLTYSFSSGYKAIDSQTLKSVVSDAFQKWTNVSQFTFVEASEGSKANIVIGFYRGDHDDGYPFDGPGGVLAHSYPPTDGRFHLDGDEKWSTNPIAKLRQTDLESVVVHEIGHLLGFGHSKVRDAIMWPYIGYGTIKRDLSQDDIVGIRTLYSN